MARTPRKWQGARNPSGLKRVRQAERRHAILQPRRSAAKTLVAKAVTVATAQPDSADVATSLSAAISALDRAAKAGAIHPNAAARRKSRLTIKINAATGGAGRRERGPRLEVHRQGRSREGREGPHRCRQGRQGQGRPDRCRQGARRAQQDHPRRGRPGRGSGRRGSGREDHPREGRAEERPPSRQPPRPRRRRPRPRPRPRRQPRPHRRQPPSRQPRRPRRRPRRPPSPSSPRRRELSERPGHRPGRLHVRGAAGPRRAGRQARRGPPGATCGPPGAAAASATGGHQVRRGRLPAAMCRPPDEHEACATRAWSRRFPRMHVRRAVSAANHRPSSTCTRDGR